MAKTTQYVAKLKTVGGTSRENLPFTLPHGCVKKVVAYSDDFNSAAIELALLDDSNIDVVPSTPIENWKQRSGGYLESMKPLDFETQGRNYNLILTNDAGNFEADKFVKVVFIYQ